MPQATVAPEVHQALDIHGHIASQVALDLIIAVDNIAYTTHLILIERIRTFVSVDFCPLQHFARPSVPYSVDVGQSDFYPLIAWKIYTGNACHTYSSALSLLMTRVFANNPHNATAPYHFTLIASLLYRSSNLHTTLLTQESWTAPSTIARA
jgi:hypothetical protein